MQSGKLKIIDKICKCLRLSESCNANEAAAALRQAHALMKKHGVTEEQIWAIEVEEASTRVGEHYTPPFWALALANLVAKAYECRSLISRRYGSRPEFHFIGMSYRPEVASYTYQVLYRHLQQAQDDFLASLQDIDSFEQKRRLQVFAQAWLFRIEQTVADFTFEVSTEKTLDDYIGEKYGQTAELAGKPASPLNGDYDDILSGMRAANGVTLRRGMTAITPLTLTDKSLP